MLAYSKLKACKQALIAAGACALLASAPQTSFARGLTNNTQFLDNFNVDALDRWEVLSGTWTLSKGQYIGYGSPRRAGDCSPTDGYSESLIRNLSARNIEFSADMTFLRRTDKIIVLRGSERSRIFVNIRADLNDINVSWVDDCHYIFDDLQRAPVPSHSVGQKIHVRVILIDDRIRVLVDDVLVLDKKFPFPLQAGRAGVGVIDDDNGPGRSAFDNIRILYGVVDKDQDGVIDGDGVTALRDRCPDTRSPERVPTISLGTGRFANRDSDLAFETKPPFAGPGEPGFNLLDTAGCSCEQIIDLKQLDLQQRRYGCTRDTMRSFVARPGG